ncbi:MAG: sulfur carrier protein ThiS [Cellvibrionaceae bacterium]
MITISLNGDSQTITENTLLSDAMVQWDFSEKKCAVAINGEFVPRSTYGAITLHDNDDIDVVAPVGGG